MNRYTAAIGASLLFSGCVISPTPYGGIALTPLPPPAPVYASAPVPVAPPTIGIPPVVITPYYVNGWGYGYWHRNHFYAYRSGCYFYNGRYYSGHHGYWH